MPGPNVPFPPQEALLVESLPAGDRWQYEPKWDGFRGVLENDDGELALWSRNGRPLLRYFPELRALGDLLPALVCEVRFDKMEANRFRHGTRFLRFRPDKEPRQCTWDQVTDAAREGDPTLEQLLPGAAAGRG